MNKHIDNGNRCLTYECEGKASHSNINHILLSLENITRGAEIIAFLIIKNDVFIMTIHILTASH